MWIFQDHTFLIDFIQIITLFLFLSLFLGVLISAMFVMNKTGFLIVSSVLFISGTTAIFVLETDAIEKDSIRAVNFLRGKDLTAFNFDEKTVSDKTPITVIPGQSYAIAPYKSVSGTNSFLHNPVQISDKGDVIPLKEKAIWVIGIHTIKVIKNGFNTDGQIYFYNDKFHHYKDGSIDKSGKDDKQDIKVVARLKYFSGYGLNINNDMCNAKYEEGVFIFSLHELQRIYYNASNFAYVYPLDNENNNKEYLDKIRKEITTEGQTDINNH